MRVLLATDGSDSAKAALDFLVNFPFPAGSEAIVLSVIDGKPFSQWIDNPNTGNQVEIWEDPFRYQV